MNKGDEQSLVKTAVRKDRPRCSCVAQASQTLWFLKKREGKDEEWGLRGKQCGGGSLVLVSTEKEGTLRDGVGDVGSAGKAVTGGDGNT